MAVNGASAVQRSLMTQSCDHCFASFATVSPKARFCCERCKNEHWRMVYKRFALVDLFMTVYALHESARYWVLLAMVEAEAKCYAAAALLGYSYNTKKRRWVKQQGERAA